MHIVRIVYIFTQELSVQDIKKFGKDLRTFTQILRG